LTIRHDRPRIFTTPELLARVRAWASASDPAYLTLKNWCDNYSGTTHHYAANFALMHLCSTNPKYGKKAIEIALKRAAAPASEWTSPRGMYLPEYIIPVALVYDWCHDVLTAWQKVTLRDALDKWANWAWPETNPERKGQWAVDNPGSNMFHAYLSSWVAGLALHSPFSESGQDHMENARTRFLDVVHPYLATVGRGGYWLEGTGYGGLSSRYLFWYLAAHLSATGEDLLNTTPFCAEYVRMLAHNTTPDGKRLVPWGAQAGYREAKVRDWEASPMRVARALLDGTTVAIADRWLETTSGRPVAKELLWESLLWGENR
jgi:hypothetical protein